MVVVSLLWLLLLLTVSVRECTTKLTGIIALELEKKLDTTEPWDEFAQRINDCKEQFWKIIDFYKGNGAKICCLGASTKSVTTDMEVTPDDVEMIGDVNPDKDGSFLLEHGFLLGMKKMC